MPRHQRSLSNASTCSSESDSIFLEQPTAYSDYLQEAQTRIAAGTAACACWAWRYDGLQPTPTQAAEMLDAARISPPMLYPKLRAHSDPVPVQSSDVTQVETKIRSSSLPSNDRTSKSEVRPVLNGVCDFENSLTRSTQPGGLGGRGERVASQGGEEENLDSLGKTSSGYESFDIRASRDSSPVNSSDGSPRSQAVHQGPSNVVEGSSQPLSGETESREKLGSTMATEEDQEFIDFLQRSTTPTELTGLQETYCEIDQAFSALKIYDVSSCKSSNKVRLEFFSVIGTYCFILR